MNHSRRAPGITKAVLVTMVLAAIAAACGQKPGTHVDASGFAPGAAGGAAGAGGDTFGGTSGTDAGDGALPGAGPGGAGDGATPGDGGDAAGGGEGPGGGGGTGGGSAKVSGRDRTGVTDDKIVLAAHAPVTGAAPLPATSFEKAADLYWRFVFETKKEKVLGRAKIELLFKDDRYQPNTAVQACRELGAKAFSLLGAGGTDQIQACGRFANQAKIPYTSMGVTENGLRGLQWYFAQSMSYKQQGQLLGHYVAKTFPGKKVAAVITDTPNFDDARDGWEAGVKSAGVNYYKTLRHPKGDTSWYTTFARELASAKVEVLYMNTSPVDYIRFAQQASGVPFTPQYVGVGVTMGLNAVLGSGCPHVDKGIFFSPFPGLDWARQNEPEFFQTAQRVGAPVDDIGLALWGANKTAHEMFKRYEQTYGSTDLTREDYRNMLEKQRTIRSDVFPELSYSPTDHFGASQVHVLQADCGSEEHKTLIPFASSF